MKNRRLYFSAVIKLLILFGLLLLITVLINSLFIKDEAVKAYDNKGIPTSIIDISGMFKGQIRKTRWQNKEVAVLLRQFPQELNVKDVKSESLHSSIDVKFRSVYQDFFVYFNIGDSTNCPLFYSAGEFKDVCSANKFDEAGRGLKDNSSNFVLKVPPHYFDDKNLIIGKWTSD